MTDLSSSNLDFSETESERYTPRHRYFTRSAKGSETSFTKYSETPETHLRELQVVLDRYPDHDNSLNRNLDFLQETNIVETSFELPDINKNLESYFTKVMDCYGSNGPCHRHGPCGINIFTQFWNKYLKFIIGIVLLGVVIHYVTTFNNYLNLVEKSVKEIKEELQGEIKLKIENLENSLTELKNDNLELEKTVSGEIEKLNGDKTGRIDFGMASAGGSIAQLTPGTENFSKAKGLFGLPLCEGSHGPRAMIQPGTSPGQCWAFKGYNGGALIKLLGKVKIDSISMEHISKNLSPTGEVKSAPRDFTVMGMRHVNDNGFYLGQFSYSIDGPLVQTFPVMQAMSSFEYLELKILSNHGNPEYTCIYRFRVHGVLESTDAKA